MRFTKKVLSITLCTALLSCGSLATLFNIAHADSNNGICARNAQVRWVETIGLKVQRKLGSGSAYLKLDLVSSNGLVKLQCDYNSVPSLYDYKFADEYVFGVKTSTGITENFKLNNNNIGAFKNGTVGSEVKNFIDTFNSLNVPSKDDTLTIFYAHGVKYDDTVIFTGQEIKRPSSKGYENGYKSRKIDKWNNGFQLRQSGIYETAFRH